MRKWAKSRLSAQILAVAISLMGIYYLALWINNTIHRLLYPFPIEFLEDAIFFHALRVYEGLPIYINPDDGFAAVIYTPGYFYLLAGLFKIMGPSIITARFISLACTLGIMAMLWALSTRRLKPPLKLVPAVVYMSLFYAHFAGYQELGRVDPLMTLMVLWGLFIIGDGKSGVKRNIAGVLLVTLACYIKQPAMAYLPFVYIFLMARDRRYGALASAVSIAVLLGLFFIIDAATNGWFRFYTVTLPLAHELDFQWIKLIFIGGFRHYAFRGILYFTLSALIYFMFRLSGPGREPASIFEITLPAAAGATLIPFMKIGGYFQDLIPLYVHLCFILPFALSLPVNGGSVKTPIGRNPGFHPGIPLILLALVFHCAYSISPWDEFPAKPGNVRLGWDYVKEIREIDGDVLMPSLGYYAWLAWKEPGYVGVALTDLIALDERPAPLMDDVRSGRYAAIVLPEYFPAESYWPENLEKYGYSGPFELIDNPRGVYDLRKNIEIPPNCIYLKTQPEPAPGP